MAFTNAKSPKSPRNCHGDDVEKLLNRVRIKLEKILLQRSRDELCDLVNCDSNIDKPERREMTRERLSQLGAIPKLAFCRLENFRLMRVLGIGSFGKVFLVRLKSHRILPDFLFPKRFSQIVNNVSENLNENEFWPEGLSENSDLCSKFWLPRTTEDSPLESVFRHYYAMKVIRKNLIIKHTNDVGHLQTELRALRQIRHPFLVHLVSSFQTEQKVFFVTEFYPGGDMFSLLDQTDRLSQNVSTFYLAEILLAIEYLHTINIIYRDLKPENVVIDLEGHCRLVDFGLCKDKIRPNLTRCMTRCGTVNYMAPEVHHYLGHGRPADFWSFGAFAYDMMCADSPVKQWRYKDPINYPSFLSTEAVSLLQGLLQTDQTKRLGTLKISETGSIISGGTVDVKNHPFFARIKDWEAVLKKRLVPPWKPQISSPMDTAYFNPECCDIYPRISFSSKYNIAWQQQAHFETFNCVNPKFFE